MLQHQLSSVSVSDPIFFRWGWGGGADPEGESTYNLIGGCVSAPIVYSPKTQISLISWSLPETSWIHHWNTTLVPSLKESGELCYLPISVINAYCYYRSVQSYSHLVHLQEALHNTVHSLIMWIVLH